MDKLLKYYCRGVYIGAKNIWVISHEQNKKCLEKQDIKNNEFGIHVKNKSMFSLLSSLRLLLVFHDSTPLSFYHDCVYDGRDCNRRSEVSPERLLKFRGGRTSRGHYERISKESFRISTGPIW